MLLQFEQTADYWRKKSEEAHRDGRILDALRCVRKAVSMSPDYDTWFGYAELLNTLRQYRMSSAVCLRYGKDLDHDSLVDVAEIMADNTSSLGLMNAYFHYQMLLLNLTGPVGPAGDEFGDLIREYFEQMTAKEEEQDLMLSTEAHRRRNHEVYDKMYKLYEANLYREVLDLAQEMHPDYPYYAESLFMQGMSYVQVGQPEEGKRCLWQMYGLTDHDARVLYYLDEIGDGITDEELENALDAITDTSSCDNMAVACICANRHNLHRRALYYAQKAYAAAPCDPEHAFRLAGAYANVGEADKSREYVRKAVNAYCDFYPLGLTHYDLEPTVDLSFEMVPQQLVNDLLRTVRHQAEGEFFAVLMQTDAAFRENVRFLLTFGTISPFERSRLAESVAEWLTPEGLEFQRQILVSPMLTDEVRYRLLYGMLVEVRRGRVRVCVGYAVDDYQLRVPASFDDYDDQLKRIYVHAYCEMVQQGGHHDLRLARQCERLYLNLPAEYYQANLMGMALLVAGGCGLKRNDAFVLSESREWDSELLAEYIDLADKAIKG